MRRREDCVDIEPDRHAQGKGVGPAVGVKARHAIERALADNEPFSRAGQRLRIARNPGADGIPDYERGRTLAMCVPRDNTNCRRHPAAVWLCRNALGSSLRIVADYLDDKDYLG